jgi:hypothetical protein
MRIGIIKSCFRNLLGVENVSIPHRGLFLFKEGKLASVNGKFGKPFLNN